MDFYLEGYIVSKDRLQSERKDPCIHGPFFGNVFVYQLSILRHIFAVVYRWSDYDVQRLCLAGEPLFASTGMMFLTRF